MDKKIILGGTAYSITAVKVFRALFVALGVCFVVFGVYGLPGGILFIIFGLVLFLFAYNYSLAIKKAEGQSSAPDSSAPSSYDFDAMDFEDKHEREIEKWNKKIDKAECSNSTDPDKIVAAYRNAITICDEFKDFCYSFDKGGISYYERNEAYRKKQLLDDLNIYLSEDYEEDKINHTEFLKQERFRLSAKKKILNLLSDNESGISRTEILSHFSKDDHSSISYMLDKLASSGELLKEKRGRFIFFQLISKQ